MADTRPNKPWWLPAWVKLPVDLKRVGEWISILRDLAALLFIPFLCLYGTLLTILLWRAFGGHDRPVEVVVAVVNFLGAALVGLVILIGLGVLWLQRRNIPSLSITTGMGTVNIGSGDDTSQAGLVAAAVDAITPAHKPAAKAEEFEPEPDVGGAR